MTNEHAAEAAMWRDGFFTLKNPVKGAVLVAHRLLAVALAVVVILLACGAKAAWSQDEVLFVDELLPPFSRGEVGKPPEGGMGLHLVNELFGRMGVEAKIILVPWARALKMVRHGKADGLPFLLERDERKFFLIFTDPVMDGGDALLYNRRRSPDFTWQGYASLKGLTVGMIRDYAYDDTLLESVHKHAGRIEYSESSEANLRKLHAGRVDVCIENVHVASAILLDNDAWRTDISIWDQMLTQFDWRMGISRKSPLAKRINEINATLAAMRRDGAMERIKRENW
jgi:polar amino acid transport system substrate-binding protein